MLNKLPNKNSHSHISTFELTMDYKNYIKQRKLATNQKSIFILNGVSIALTQKQIRVLKLVAKGFSNTRIAKEISVKASTIKLLIYRLMRYLETVLFETIDRFYLVIIAQQIDFDES